MRRLPFAFFLLVTVVVGVWLYSSYEEPASATEPEGSLARLELNATSGEETELQTPEPDSSLAKGSTERDEQPAATPVASNPEADAAPADRPVDELAGWSGPWSKDVEKARRTFMDSESSFDAKGSALKWMAMMMEPDGEDPRSEEVLREAAWILDHTSDVGVLDDVLDGLEGVEDEELVEPVIACLIHHESAKVRGGAVGVLQGFEGNERAKVALEHAAQYDEDERVRLKAAQAAGRVD